MAEIPWCDVAFRDLPIVPLSTITAEEAKEYTFKFIVEGLREYAKRKDGRSEISAQDNTVNGRDDAHTTAE